MSLIFDLFAVVLSFTILNYRNRLTFYHPGTLLLAYHVFSYSFRAFSLENGAALLGGGSIKPASMDEIYRALFWADIVLIFSSVAIFLAEAKTIYISNIRLRPLSKKIFYGVLLFSIPLGIWGTITYLYIPSFDVVATGGSETYNSNYFTATQTWLGLSFLALVYFKGFKKKYFFPLVIYLVLIALQGYHRTRLVLPVVFIIVTYLYYYNLRWPPKRHLVIMFILLILFFPLKYVGRAIQEGNDLASIGVLIEESFVSTTKGESADQTFLDQYAMALTEIDNKDHVYLGRTLAPLLVLPIPRAVYPQKPSMAQWVIDISSVERPFSTIGAALSLYGESYANFRYFGLVLIPALLFHFLTRWYRIILLKSLNDIDKFFYLIVFCSMIQVMRDGLYALVMFPVVNFLPLFLIYFLHRVFTRPKLSYIR